MSDEKDKLGKGVLLVTAVALRRIDGQVCLDDQTCDGLVRWAENFDKVVFAGIQVADGSGRDDASTVTWRKVSDLPCSNRLELILLPNAYRIQDFATRYRTTRGLLAAKVRECRYLCFTLGALIGDWGAIAGLSAIRQKRDFAVWFDRVEHEVVRNTLSSMPPLRRTKEFLSLPLMKRYHRYLISRSAVGLFQGQDCFRHYARYARKAFCVYDTHTRSSDHIDERALLAKAGAVRGGETLRICYAGRAAAMKGPLDWLRTITLVRKAGVNVAATWLGDGPMLETMRALADELGLSGSVDLPGFQGDRTKVLETLREAHVFLSCHLTPESPRCFVEALVSGLPLVGYASSYAKELVAEHGGGLFGPMGDPVSLAKLVVRLDADRDELAGLIMSAAASGRPFDEESVYRRRAELIRHHLQ